MPATCPSDNTQSVDQGSFWNSSGIHWDAHRIGWAIAGGFTVATVIITIIPVTRHATNYRVRDEQRQIIRILYMPLVYAIVSFFSYRFFRDYTYYSLVEVVYEAFTLSAFLLLLIQYVAASAVGHSAEAALARKARTSLPIPFCFIHFHPTKPAFMHTLKWCVMQYTVVRPAITIAGIVTQYYGILCESSWSPKFAAVYLTSVDTFSISVALYALIVFYVLTHHELAERKPLAKFLCIKLIVFATFYQSFVFDALQNYGVIKSTPYWTSTNIADGLNALAICIEMVFFSVAMMWAYPASDYTDISSPKLGFFRAIIDSLNFSDFAFEIYTSLRFFVDYVRGKPDTRSKKQQIEKGHVDFDSAFGLGDGSTPLAMSDNRPFFPQLGYDEEAAAVGYRNEGSREQHNDGWRAERPQGLSGESLGKGAM